MSHTSTTVADASSNMTLNIANSGVGNGVYNAIKFSGNQQDTYIMSFNNNTQANRRLGFFVGSSAGDAASDEVLSLYGSGSIDMNGKAGTSPILQLINNDNEDVNTGRETSVRFSGHRSGGEDVVNAQISGSHFGSADDDEVCCSFTPTVALALGKNADYKRRHNLE